MENINFQPEQSEKIDGLDCASSAPLGKKRDVAKMLNVSCRTVDNYIAEGCPFIKPSARCCRFDLADVKVWFKTQYGQQSRKSW